MRLVVEILTGTLFYVQVDDDATVQDLKREIGLQEKLPQERLLLVLYDDNQTQLMKDDEQALVDHGVRDGSHIYLFFNPVDDGSHYRVFSTLPDSLTR